MSCGAPTTGRCRTAITALRLVILAIPVVVLFGVMRLTAGSIGSEGTSWHL